MHFFFFFRKKKLERQAHALKKPLVGKKGKEKRKKEKTSNQGKKEMRLVLGILILFVAAAALCAGSLPTPLAVPQGGGTILKRGLEAKTAVFRDSPSNLFTNLWKESDPSSFTSTVSRGVDFRLVFDRRQGSWNTVQMRVFDAVFDDQAKSPVEIHVNPEFGDQAACALVASDYLPALGRVPTYLRQGLNAITIHAGNYGWAVGSGNLIIHTENTYFLENGNVDETIAWSLATLSLSGPIQASQAWNASVTSDPMFISDFALSNPSFADVAESYIAWYAARVVDTSRVSGENKTLIENGIPARLDFLDQYYLDNFSTDAPTLSPSFFPSSSPSSSPSVSPSSSPSSFPTSSPTTSSPYYYGELENAESLQTSKYASFGLFSISWVLVLLFGAIVVVFRKHPVIRVAQPVFCAMVLAGVALSSVSILLFTVDGGVDNLQEEEDSMDVWTRADTACMASVWFFGIGFMLMYSALLVKMNKILLIFNMEYAMGAAGRAKVSVRRNVKLVLGLVAVEVAILLAWTISSPLRYTYTVVNTIQRGNISVELKRGTCSSDNLSLFAILAAYHIAILAYCMRVALKTSNIHTAFSEGKYVRFAVYNGLQFSLIAIPMLYLTNDASTAMFLRAAAIGLHDAAFLGLLFGPKLLMIIRGVGTENGQGKDIMIRAEESSLKSSSSSSSSPTPPSFPSSSAASLSISAETSTIDL